MKEFLELLVTIVVVLSCCYGLYYVYNRYVDEGVHPYTGKKRYTLFYEFFRNLIFLFAVIFIFFYAVWWISAIMVFMYLTHLSMTLQKYGAVRDEKVMDIWIYSEENKEKARQAFEQTQTSKLATHISTDKIVFTTRYLYVNDKTKLKINQNTMDNIIFDEARIEGDFLVLRYLVSVLPARTYYLYITNGQRKSAKKLVTFIESSKKQPRFTKKVK